MERNSQICNPRDLYGISRDENADFKQADIIIIINIYIYIFIYIVKIDF